MNELIKITTNEQGSDVVSARELHEFLEVKTRFNDWIKSRIIKYGFQQDTDFVEVEIFTENSVKIGKGRPETEYALTLDMAKELSMVENNEKGKIARRYFIEAEKALHKIAAVPTTEQVLIQLVSQQTKIMADTQLMLAQLRADVDEIKAGYKPTKPARNVSAPHLPVPQRRLTSPLRLTVTQKVNDYCTYHDAQQSEAYNYLYKRMHDVYGINVHRLHRKPGEYMIDAIERYGHLERLYGLVMAELIFIEQ